MEIKIIQNKKNEVSFKIINEIVPCSRPKISRFAVYYPPKYTKFKKELEKQIRNSFKIKEEFHGKPLDISIEVFKEIPKSLSKKKKEELKLSPVIKRPDLDNYYKAILDSLGNVFYTDDSFISKLSGSKYYSDTEFEYAIVCIKAYEN